MFKPGVKINGIKPEIALGIATTSFLFQSLNLPLTITSVTEGTHSPTSLHYVGYAFDVRIMDVPLSANILADKLREALTDEFDVVVEKDHIHVEFQPKRA